MTARSATTQQTRKGRRAEQRQIVRLLLSDGYEREKDLPPLAPDPTGRYERPQ